MKFILTTLSILFSSITGNQLQAQSNLSFALTANVNNSFIGNQSEVNDFVGYSSYNPNFGFGLGGLMQWKIAPHFDLNTGLIVDVTSVGYRYYSVFTRTSGTYFNIPLSVQFNIPSKTNNNFYIQLGTNILISLINSTAHSERLEAEPYLPAYTSTTRTRAGISPQLLTGLGWRCTTHKGRTLEYSFIFNKGFIPVTTIDIHNISEGITSIVESKNTQLKFQVNWYFKHMKND